MCYLKQLLTLCLVFLCMLGVFFVAAKAFGIGPIYGVIGTAISAAAVGSVSGTVLYDAYRGG